MKDFTLTSSIPTNCNTEVLLRNDTLFFASHTSLYNPGLFFTASDPIVSFDIAEHIFILTEKEIMQVDRFGKVLTSMKMMKRCRFVKCHNNNVILFKNNCIEIYKIPVCYNNVNYKLTKRLFIENLVTKCSFYENLMLCSYDTNAVCLFDIYEGKETMIGTFIEDIVNVFITKERIYIVCARVIIIYSYIIDHSQEDFISKSIEKKIKMEKIISATANKENTLYIASKDSDNVVNIAKLDRNEITETIDQTFESLDFMTVENDTLVVKTNAEITKYNCQSKVTEEIIDTSDILCYNHFRDLIFVASTNRIKIYKNGKMLRKHTMDVETKIVFIHGTKNIIMTISSLGTVRLYDTSQFYCFKTFDLPFNVLTSEVNEDMSLLFFANKSIMVYDMKKGKQIDELTGHTSPITKLVYKNGYLYSLGLDGIIRKQYVFDTNKQAQELENISNKTVIDFAVNNNVYVMLDNEVCVYDTSFEFVKTFYTKDQRKIIFEKIAVVNDSFVAIYGKYKNYKDEKISIVQIYSLVFSIKVQEFECESIESIRSFNSELILQSHDLMHFYGQKSKFFDPVELETDCSPEKIEEHLRNHNFYFALLLSIKLKDSALIEKVISLIPVAQISEIVKLLPQKFVEILRSHIDSCDCLSIEWIKNIIYYHPNVGKRLQLNDKQREIHDVMRKNKYMLEVMSRINK